jgi:hypothetical protein
MTRLTQEERTNLLKFLDTLSDALGNSDDQTVEEIKTELMEDGVDVDAVRKRIENFWLGLTGSESGDMA